MQSQDRQPNRGRFQAGHDPRRHEFTTDERRLGFANAVRGAPLYRIRWLCARVRATASPERAAAHDAQQRRRFLLAMQTFD